MTAVGFVMSTNALTNSKIMLLQAINMFKKAGS